MNVAKVWLFPVFVCFFLAPLCAGEGNEKQEKEKEVRIKEYVVVTAAAVKEPEKDVLGPVSLIKEETIRRWKLVTLNEALEFAGGELSLASGSYGQLSSTQIRGASSTHTLFMVNNIRLNDPATLSLDVGSISPQLFGQVEIVDGPQSSLYGSDAMGGVVNMISRHRDGLQASFWGGMASTFSSQLSGGRQLTPSLRLDGGYNFFRTAGSEANADFLAHNLFVEAGWHPGPFSAAPFFYGVRSTGGVPFNMGAASPQRRTDTDLFLLGLPLKLSLSHLWNLDFTGGYYTRNYRLLDPLASWSRDYRTFSRNLQFTGRVLYYGLGDESPAMVGAEFLSSWIDEETEGVPAFSREPLFSHAFWLEQVVKLKNFQAVLALRYDKFKSFPSHLSPRLSLRYGRTFNPSLYAGVYAAVNGGFRAPKPTEYASEWGNPDLKPESSFNREGGVLFSFSRFSLQAGLFHTAFDDMIVFNYASYMYDNSGRNTIRGWQIKPEWRLGTLSCAVSFQKLAARNDRTGERLLRRPDFILKALLSGEWGKFTLDLMGRWVGKRSDYDELTYAVADAEAFSSFSLAAAWHLKPSLTLSARVSNFLDQRYEEILGYPAPGRLVYLGLDFSL